MRREKGEGIRGKEKREGKGEGRGREKFSRGEYDLKILPIHLRCQNRKGSQERTKEKQAIILANCICKKHAGYNNSTARTCCHC